MNPMIFEDWPRRMERFSKEIRRSSNIGDIRWKDDDKILVDLLKQRSCARTALSAIEDGKMMKKF